MAKISLRTQNCAAMKTPQQSVVRNEIWYWCAFHTQPSNLHCLKWYKNALLKPRILSSIAKDTCKLYPCELNPCLEFLFQTSAEQTKKQREWNCFPCIHSPATKPLPPHAFQFHSDEMPLTSDFTLEVNLPYKSGKGVFKCISSWWAPQSSRSSFVWDSNIVC